MIESNSEAINEWGHDFMGKHGKIPAEYGGGNKYRVIWAMSRLVTLMLDRGPTVIPMYIYVEPLPPPARASVWILEKWMSPSELAGGVTQEEWNTPGSQWLMQGPYPNKGDYVMAGMPLTCLPQDANFDKLISWIEAGRNSFTPAQHAIAIQNEVDAREATQDRIRREMIEDRMLPFGGEAWSGRTSAATGRNGRGTKIISPKYSANDLGMPTKPGIHPHPHRKAQTFQVPLGDQ